MCGIIGYVGEKQVQSILLKGLKRLEYRGYDSCGMVTFLDQKNSLSVRKLSGKVANLEKLLEKRPLLGKIGIAHNRWATHGLPNQVNAHPHLDCNNEIALVHNGIIENYAQLKSELIKEGHHFRSSTDTEVIVHLIEKFYKNSSLLEATRKALIKLKGSFAIAVISKKEPDKLVGARSGSPLIVGIGEGENFLASDIPAVLDHTKQVLFLGENELVALSKDKVLITNLKGESVNRQSEEVSWDVKEAQKQGFPHFMLKEIHEQPKVLENILKQRVVKERDIFFEELVIAQEYLSRVNNIVIVACGTAYHAGLCGKYILEETCAVPVSVDLSSEFRYRRPLLGKQTLVIAISQSGETADTLAAAREAKELGAQVLAICNVLGSSLAREADGVIFTRAGPEIGVASTKAYTAQLAVLYLFAMYLGRIRKTLAPDRQEKLLEELSAVPQLQESILKNQRQIKLIGRRHSHFGCFLFLGRNINYPSALEGALKLKEISYIPAEGYAAGEMKHGPIALIDEYRAVVCIAVESRVYEKMISNIQEIRSRQGRIIVIATAGDNKIKEHTREVIYLPAVDEFLSPLLVALPLQLLAYYVAVKRGADVDQPRNLAKSVTVE
jgi:glucosamine--fructose-6-phosphate aminotransferase (isomerizing)